MLLWLHSPRNQSVLSYRFMGRHIYGETNSLTQPIQKEKCRSLRGKVRSSMASSSGIRAAWALSVRSLWQRDEAHCPRVHPRQPLRPWSGARGARGVSRPGAATLGERSEPAGQVKWFRWEMPKGVPPVEKGNAKPDLKFSGVPESMK